MKKIVLAAAVAAMTLAPAATAESGPNANANQRATVKTCNNLKARMGASNFRALFAPKTQNARAALRNCVRREVAAQQLDRMHAAQTCKTWKTDAAAFAAAMQGTANEGKTFAQVYGSGRNAYGKCVAAVARQNAAARRAALVNAAKTCRAWKTDAAAFAAAMQGTANEGKTFGDVYGSGRNAYGKCVSAQAKAKSA